MNKKNYLRISSNRKTNMRKTNMRKTNMRKTNMRKTNMRKTKTRKTNMRKTKTRKTKTRKTKTRKNRHGGDTEFPLDDRDRRKLQSSDEYRDYMYNCRVKNPFTGKFTNKPFSPYCKKQLKKINDMANKPFRSAITIDDEDVQNDIAIARQNLH